MDLCRHQMGDADGYLFYSCQGARAADLSHMPPWLIKVCRIRLKQSPPLLYRHCAWIRLLSRDFSITGRSNTPAALSAGTHPGTTPQFAAATQHMPLDIDHQNASTAPRQTQLWELRLRSLMRC
jgi:hypothetical protein